MDTNTLQTIIKRDIFSKSRFCGVLPIDKLPKKKLERNCSFILNLDDSDNIGSHWVAIWAPMNENYEYFDSFGENPNQKEIYKFFKLNNKNFIFNSYPIQNINSRNCGLYCLIYILLRSRNISMLNIIKLLNKFKQNNESLNNLLCKILYKNN